MSSNCKNGSCDPTAAQPIEEVTASRKYLDVIAQVNTVIMDTTGTLSINDGLQIIFIRTVV